MAEILPVPASLKSIRPYVKVGMEIAKQDPVVSYYCNFYAMQTGLKLDYKTLPDAKQYLLQLMTHVERQKEDLKNNPEYSDGVTNDITGQALVESAAMKLFAWADSQDRKSVFNKHVVKSFYTASILFDVLQVFDEPVSEEIHTHQKYARWKATYIHNCLKNNETPIPGPVGGLEDEWRSEADNETNTTEKPEDKPSTSLGANVQVGTNVPGASAQPKPAPRDSAPVQPQPVPRSAEQPQAHQESVSQDVGSGVKLSHKDFAEAEKLCKYAASALQYQDIPTAVGSLEKCLKLLRTGKQ